MPPLYKVIPSKGEEVYLYDDAALEKYRRTHTGNFTLQRYKGLGEMDADQLWETTLNPDLYKIIRFLNSNNVYVAVLSNGIDIKDELIDTLKLHKKNKVQVSIDGLEKTHDFIRGEGTFKKSIEGIKKLLSNDINVSSNMVVHEQNFNDVLNVREYINSIGCKKYGCMLYAPQDNNYLNFLSKENLEMYMNKYKPHSNSCNGTFKCTVGFQSVIREDGGFSFCGRGYDEPITNYFTDSDDTILYKMKTFTIRYRSVPVYCFNCAKVSSCLGGSMCNSSYQNGICVFNTEDRICHVLDNKVVGDMYDIQTVL
jgi:MoaA/NifB/PqqE/SkfB family radical SAM enzyme